MTRPNAADSPTYETPVQLSGSTGSADTTTAGEALTAGAFATIMVADVGVRVVLSSGGTAATTATGIPVGPWGRFDWVVDSGSTRVSIIAQDGSSTATAAVFQSSPSP